MLIDSWQRSIQYLRISITDRCNLRCVYCMPPEEIKRLPREGILRYEEIAQVVREAAGLGVRRVRITGGEPLVRPDVTSLIRMIAAVKGIEDISLTTNGLRLVPMALELKAAGLMRINISLDSLQPEKFARITRGGSFEAVWRGIEAAERAGLNPIKLNVVVMRGVNDDELPALARLTIERSWDVRFIELMPVSNSTVWGEGFPDTASTFMPAAEIKARLAPLGLEPVSDFEANGPARLFRLKSPVATGRIGLISPVSEHFCQACNRLRLTADGHLRPCLLHEGEIDVLAALRRGESIAPYLRLAVASKPQGHNLDSSRPPSGRCMRQIGG